ncbi:UvrD-helicase domain-containing protein [Methanococcus voltae]|uniref:UvrD-helicase domain-containing protein n=1 Tax=Methanococcus voltae TaxID=2188 RepID=UPI001AEAB55F|nr:UvrD-helicase domain-containing protein [Methanococcus voltae]MBP2172040.1 superfamily I DNA and RNA helicase [Methanococcus voltae]
MGIDIIPDDVYGLKKGELKLLNKIKEIYSEIDNYEGNRNCVLYLQQSVCGLKPDFILIDSFKGVCILEVKDWKIGYLKNINSHQVETIDNKTFKNPIVISNIYFNKLKDLIYNDEIFREKKEKSKKNKINTKNIENSNKFEMPPKIYSYAVFSKIKSEEIKKLEINKVLNQPPSKYITSDKISELTIDDLFDKSKDVKMSNIEFNRIRSLLCPEIFICNSKQKIKDKNHNKDKYNNKKDSKLKKLSNLINLFKIINKLSSKDGIEDIIDYEKDSKELIKVLDLEQEKISKKIPNGHFMITGVPGSGKTVILLSRAVFLALNNPTWKIRILTYNRTLSEECKANLKIMCEKIGNNDILNNIEVSTFHKFAKELYYEYNKCFESEEFNNFKIKFKTESKQFWNYELPNKVLNILEDRIDNNMSLKQYDAVLIDEYQDFMNEWIKICVKSCKKYPYIDYAGKNTEGINLFLAGDRIQSIYRLNGQNWKSLGIDMRGRSKLLKSTYRTGKEHLNLGINFLMKNDELKNQVYKFYNGTNTFSVLDGNIEFLSGKNEVLNDKIKELLTKFKPEEIMILCNDNKSCEKLYYGLDSDLKKKCSFSKNLEFGYIRILTLHSSKGLESPVCVITNLSKINKPTNNVQDILNRKLIYVGITRAFEHLILHSEDFNNSYAKELRDIVLKK